MSEENQTFSVSIEQVDGFEFRVRFDDTHAPDLLTDEPAPLGEGKGPNPSRLIVAGVMNCLSASLLFALRKFKNQPTTIRATAITTMVRNADKRLRIGKIAVKLELPGESADYTMLERALTQFENFCVVTESVRDGIQVDVNVVDAQGNSLHQTSAGGHA